MTVNQNQKLIKMRRFTPHISLFLTWKNGFSEVKKAFKSYAGQTYRISIIKETNKHIEFLYKNIACYISDNGRELNYGVQNVVDTYYSIPTVFDIPCDIVVPQLIVTLILDYLSVMIEKFRSFQLDAFSQEYSKKIRLDFIHKVFKKHIQHDT